MSTHNICFCREIGKISAFFRCKKRLICCYAKLICLKTKKTRTVRKKLLKKQICILCTPVTEKFDEKCTIVLCGEKEKWIKNYELVKKVWPLSFI